MRFRAPLDRKWLLPTLICVVAMNYMDRSVLGIVGDAMKADMGFTDAQLGLIHSILLMTLIVLIIPGAVANDLWKRRRFIGLCVGLWGLAMAGTAAASSFSGLVVARMMGSLNEASVGSGGTAWLSSAYPPEKRGRILGIFQIGAPLGMAMGMLLGSAVLSITGSWRAAFALFVIPALAAAFLIPRLPDSQARAANGFFHGVRGLLRKRTILLVGTAAGFFCVLKYSYQAWMPILLIRSYGLEPAYAGPMAACFLLAGMAGPFLGGMLSDFWAARDAKGRVRTAAFLMVLIVISKTIFYCLLGKVSLPVICAAGVLDGMILMTPIPVYFAIIQDVVEDEYRGSATGIFGAMTFFAGGAWGPMLVGLLSDMFGGQNGLLYAMASLVVFGVLSAAAYLLSLKYYGKERI